MTELLLSNSYGTDIIGNGQFIRISGNSTTTPAFIGNGTTKNQIQFFTNNNCVSAVDTSGLYFSESSALILGNSTQLAFSHNGTSSSVVYDTLSFISNNGTVGTLNSTGLVLPYALTSNSTISSSVYTQSSGTVSISQGMITNGTLSVGTLNLNTTNGLGPVMKGYINKIITYIVNNGNFNSAGTY